MQLNFINSKVSIQLYPIKYFYNQHEFLRHIFHVDNC